MMTFILFVVAIAGLLVVMRQEGGAKQAITVMVVVGLASLMFASGTLALILSKNWHASVALHSKLNPGFLV